MTIKFHYHNAVRDVPRLGIRRGDRCCHVYSDESLQELISWTERVGIRPEWLDRRHVLPHFDAHGEWLRVCGPGVNRRELTADIRAWRSRAEDPA